MIWEHQVIPRTSKNHMGWYPNATIVGWLTPKRKQLPSIWSRNGLWLHLGHASGAEYVLSALKRNSFKVLSHELFRDLKEWPIPFGTEIRSIFKIMKAKPSAFKEGPVSLMKLEDVPAVSQWWEEDVSKAKTLDSYNFCFGKNPWFWVNCNWIHQPEFD